MTSPKTLSTNQMSSRRRVFLARSALVTILGPAVIYALYLLILAPPQYEASATFAIRGAQPNQADLFGAIGLVAPTTASTDARIVDDYIRSQTMVDELKAHYGFSSAYDRFSLDPTARLSTDASHEKATRFWRRKVDVRYDLTTAASTVSVKAYTPADALRLIRGVMLEGEELVNTMSDRAMSDISAAATAELERKRQEYEAAKARLSAFQGRRSSLEISAPAEQAIGLVGQLDATLAQKRAELATQSQTYQPNAPQMTALRREIAAIEAERQRAVSRALAAPGEAAASGEVQARSILLDYEFAQQAYQGAERAVEAARRQDITARKYVVAYVPPKLPEKSDRWSRLSNVLAVLIGSALLWAVAALSYSIIRDHME